MYFALQLFKSVIFVLINLTIVLYTLQRVSITFIFNIFLTYIRSHIEMNKMISVFLGNETAL